TYQPSHESLLYPENIKHVMCLKTLDSAIFDTLKNVESVILIDTHEEALEPFIRDKLPTLKNLKSFNLNSKRKISLSNRNELIKALKQCPSLESLKINVTQSQQSPTGLPTIDLSFFPHLKTLHVNQTTVISNFHKSSLIDLSMVITHSCKSSYDELIKTDNLKHLKFLSIVFEASANQSPPLDLSFYPLLTSLRIEGNRDYPSKIQNLNKLIHLEKLDLSGAILVNQSKEPIPFDFSFCPHLTFLRMDGSYYFPSKIQNLNKLIHLEKLDLSGVILVNQSEEPIPLDLSFCPQISSLKMESPFDSPFKIQNLNKLIHLEKLDLYRTICVNQSGEPIPLDLSFCPHLSSLIIKANFRPPFKIQNLNTLIHLETLDLFETICVNQSEEPIPLDLSHCHILKNVKLMTCPDVPLIKGLNSCENLTNLTITFCKHLLSNPTFRNELRKLPQKLIHLNLSCNNIDNISCIPFSRLTNLRYLNLRINSINRLPDELAQLPSSCTVDLTYNEMSKLTLKNFNSKTAAQLSFIC
ncbi:MAG: hypothetical protein ACOVP4_06355, partial [Bacteriovoracaceae bacterium]